MRPPKPNSIEPPRYGPVCRWRGRGGAARHPPIPIWGGNRSVSRAGRKAGMLGQVARGSVQLDAALLAKAPDLVGLV